MTAAAAGAPRPERAFWKLWGAWVAIGVIVVACLVFGTIGQAEPTPAERAQSLAESIRCPSCKGQSAASSDTPSSQAVRLLIRQRIAAGDSNEEIRDFVASRYGRQILLDPSGSGIGAWVWALPAIFVVVAVAGLIIRFRGYKTTPRHATAADRDLVAAALVADHGGDVAAAPDDDEAGG